MLVELLTWKLSIAVIMVSSIQRKDENWFMTLLDRFKNENIIKEKTVDIKSKTETSISM